MEKKKILSPNKKYKQADGEDLTINLKLEANENLMRLDERDIILNLSELFDEERNKSVKYKVHGKMKMVFRNMYYGDTSYSPLLKKLYLTGDGSNNVFTGYLPYDEFAFIRRDIVREINQPSTGNTLTTGTFTPNTTIVGDNSHRTITQMDASNVNWNLYLSYVYGEDETYPMNYTLSGGTATSFIASQGIPFRVELNDKEYILTSPVPHGMKEGEFVILEGIPLTGTTESRCFYINSVGGDIFNSEKYVININKSQISNLITLSGVLLGKRCLDKTRIDRTTSRYYVHKHKTLTENDDYILDNLGFETPIFEHERKLLFENSEGVNDLLVEKNRPETVMFDFKSPLTLSGITNNLGYTPTEVYVTTIFRNGDGFFNYPPKVGHRFNFHNTWIDDHFDDNNPNLQLETTIPSTTITSNTSGTTPSNFTIGLPLSGGTELFGAFVEYNEEEFKERIISESYHKLTSPINIFDHGQDDPLIFSGSSGTNLNGLFYQPHNRIKLRELSPYVETGNTDKIDNLPENTKYDDYLKLWKWRDLYDHGYIDVDGNGTNFPFLNDIHYVKSDINFYLFNEVEFKNKADQIKKLKKPFC
jgi:hypothetical protein